jgi:hypothetical protein
VRWSIVTAVKYVLLVRMQEVCWLGEREADDSGRCVL